MRPPAIQAERRHRTHHQQRAASRFNEAACNTGGTRVVRRDAGRTATASMRPPAIQAERWLAESKTWLRWHASMRPPAIQAERKGSTLVTIGSIALQ